MPGLETPEVSALQALDNHITGIDPSLVALLIQYSKATDAKIKIALLKQIDAHKSLALFLDTLNTSDPTRRLPSSVALPLQNLRNTLMLVQRFKTDDTYIDILSRTGWIAPPDGAIRDDYSKGLVEAIALAHAYEFAPNTVVAERQYKALIQLLQSSEFKRGSDYKIQGIIANPKAVGAMPRLMVAFVTAFGRSQLAGDPADERHANAIEAVKSAHDWIQSYRDARNAQARKNYERAYQAALGKLGPNDKLTPQASAISNDITAGRIRMGVASKAQSDVTVSKATESKKVADIRLAIDQLSRVGPTDLSFTQRATEIYNAARQHHPDPPRPPKVSTQKELADYSKSIKSWITATKPIVRNVHVGENSKSASRGIGIITASEGSLSNYEQSQRDVLGGDAVQLPKTTETDIEKIRHLKPDLGLGKPK